MTLFRCLAASTIWSAGFAFVVVDGANAVGPLATLERPIGTYQFAASSVAEMPPGMRTAYVRGLQEALAAHGYRPGPADGQLGPRTRGAVRAYERDAGLPITGQATDEILNHLNFARPKVMARISSEPSATVLAIQRALRGRGYDPGPADGLIGARTRDAIRQYQTDAGLARTGKADKALLQELRAAN